MKVLTVRQPLAALLINGAKRVEYRAWSTTHRGPLLIHAAKGAAWSVDDPELIEALPRLVADVEVRGAIVGLVTVTGCRWAGDSWAWDVADPVRFAEPIPWRGAPGLFEVDVP